MKADAQDNIIEARALTKRFHGFAAVNDVDLSVRRHSVHALIGPNGAGKTTMFNLITKFLSPTAGTIVFNGEDITPEDPAEVARRGIVRSFQISAIYPRMTVADNVRIALQRPLGTAFHFWKSVRTLDVLDARIDALLEAVGLLGHRDQPAGGLPYGRKRALEFATTLALEPELMLLDEPTSGLGHEDVDRIAELIGTVSANRTILMVEHNLSVVARLADTITVLARGQVLAEGPYAEISQNPEVVDAYIGGSDD
ncbi:ABC transporter ATP-binding protein [Aquibium sp. A9E412]|uniref:ABC transporter ATP-binding protein n=1 Tax=Aquibium sp. A9E412 TaxID=2976767 RepID=UPI0025B0E931|nr:ABC transporter ATP-binding protein [Aquibium sp. A9E412]MDN2568335.1 ABC transporter ATP-binding protein [Aquibium sp. A9E412]